MAGWGEVHVAAPATGSCGQATRDFTDTIPIVLVLVYYCEIDGGVGSLRLWQKK
jgi:hypothetical protein